MKTIWSPLEIAGSYRRSGCSDRQITIIAQCNNCSRETVKEVLREQGFEIKQTNKEAIMSEGTIAEKKESGKAAEEKRRTRKTTEESTARKSKKVLAKDSIPDAVKDLVAQRIVQLGRQIKRDSEEIDVLKGYLGLDENDAECGKS